MIWNKHKYERLFFFSFDDNGLSESQLLKQITSGNKNWFLLIWLTLYNPKYIIYFPSEKQNNNNKPVNTSAQRKRFVEK